MNQASPIDQLALLPQDAGSVWQGGTTRLPIWAEDPKRGPFRPLAFLWLNVQEGTFGPVKGNIVPDGESVRHAMLDTLVRFATDDMGGCRPQRLEVSDKDLAGYLSDALHGLKIEVVHRARLVMWESELRSLWKTILGRDPLAGYLDGKDVTIERLRAFADAAQAFHRGNPWRLLGNDDLIKLDCPRPSRAPRYVVVMGAAGTEFGLNFCQSEDDFWRYRSADDTFAETVLENGVWSVSFSHIVEFPLADADLWEDYALPVDDDEAYPLAARYFPSRVRRPSAAMLAYFEAVLRALATTEDEDLARGRWTRRVASYDGDMQVTLSLPFLLDPPSPQELARHGFFDRRSTESLSVQIRRFVAEKGFTELDEINEALRKEFVGRVRGETDKYPPQTPLEEAQDLCYQAFDSVGYRRSVLARRALEISKDCADAYVLLAEASVSLQEQDHLYAAGVDAGRRALGDAFFAEPPEHAWGRVDARPALRAMLGLAYVRTQLDQVDEAIAGYQDLLRINPDDNQGVRYLLLPLLIAGGQDDDAKGLIAQYADEEPLWPYARALLAFRKEGDTTGPRRTIRKAIRQAPYIAEVLLGADEIDDMATGLGEEDAFFFADILQSAWEASEGALDWLASQWDAVGP